MLSLLATTVSIALTFGTAAIIDHNKEQNEKHEIVMMVLYDMYNSLQSIEKSDTMIRKSMELQRQIAEEPEQFDKLRYQLAILIPRVEYTETTERIVSSSIETINTVGNVLFTENVAGFYQLRHLYKTEVCDSACSEIATTQSFSSIENTMAFNYSIYAITSCGILMDMQRLYDQTRKMMGVSREEIDAYREQREKIEKEAADDDEASDSIIHEIMQLQAAIGKNH